jgi:hypothetical protein
MIDFQFACCIIWFTCFQSISTVVVNTPPNVTAVRFICNRCWSFSRPAGGPWPSIMSITQSCLIDSITKVMTMHRRIDCRYYLSHDKRSLSPSNFLDRVLPKCSHEALHGSHKSRTSSFIMAAAATPTPDACILNCFDPAAVAAGCVTS